MLGIDTHITYVGIVVMLVLTGMGLPIPEEVPIILAGAASSYGEMNPWIAYGCCLGGALVGDCVMYAVGYYFGYGLLRKRSWFTRLLRTDRESQVEAMFARHGLKVLFFARFLVGIRGPVYLASGILRVPFRQFLLIDALSVTAVITFFFGMSYMFASQVEPLWKMIREGQLTLTAIVLTAVAGVAFFLWRRHRKKPRIVPEAPDDIESAKLDETEVESTKNVA